MTPPVDEREGSSPDETAGDGEERPTPPEGESSPADEAVSADTSTEFDGVEERVERIHGHLRATEELPVDRTAARWIGEAAAVTADVAEADEELPADLLRERTGHVRDLLESVDDTDNPEADEHVAAALDLARAVAGDANRE